LHDEILPRLHAALLTLGTAAPLVRAGARDDSHAEPNAVAEAAGQITDAHREIANLLRSMPSTMAPRIAQAGLLGALRQVIDGELAGSFETVTWDVSADVDEAIRAMQPLPAEVLFGAAREAVRNAAHYGRDGDPGRPLHLVVAASMANGDFQMRVEDDGVGLAGSHEAQPRPMDDGWAGDPTPRSGQGLGLHSTMMAVIGGTLTAESAPDSGTRVTLTLPARLDLVPGRSTLGPESI